ncbi:MAG: nucleotidyltransferase family protein [Planctomycetes bacterium]|nr:nucleotidyltransferase family protein [Planctomycetota bacterium]
MGEPKVLLDLGGEPALSRMLRVLRAVPIEHVVVVLRSVTPRLRRSIALESVTTAINVAPEGGQLTSLRIGLANLAATSDAFLVCPVDVPLFEDADVRALLDAWRSRSDRQSIVVPSHGGKRGHPALFARALKDEFLALADGEPANVVVRKDPARVVHVVSDNAWLVRDLDTPRDRDAAALEAEARRARTRSTGV